MGNNTDKNSSNVNDGILGVIGFAAMAFLLFFVAFYMGREMGRYDETVFEEYEKTLETDRDEMAGKLENIESKIGNLELKIGELEEKIDEMRVTAMEEEESGADKDTNDNGTTDE